jgi:hypothetical protein
MSELSHLNKRFRFVVAFCIVTPCCSLVGEFHKNIQSSQNLMIESVISLKWFWRQLTCNDTATIEDMKFLVMYFPPVLYYLIFDGSTFLLHPFVIENSSFILFHQSDNPGPTAI